MIIVSRGAMRIGACLLLLIGCLGALESSAGQADEISLSISGDLYSFSPVDKQYPSFSIFGEYAHPYAYTGGTTLHLYPDNHFTVIDWCDICGEDLVANGSYRFKGGLVTLDYAYARKTQRGPPLPKTLLAFHGIIQMPDYITGSKFILIRPEDLEGAKREPNYSDYLIMTSAYPDWRAIYHDQLRKKGREK